MSNETTPDKLPCPFCGGVGLGESVSNGQWWIECICGVVVTSAPTRKAAIDIWNTRRMRTFKDRAADALADEVAVLVQRKVIDSRSPAADALLDFRNPPMSEHSSRMVTLEVVVEQLQGERDIARKERNADRAELVRLRAVVGEMQALAGKLDGAIICAVDANGDLIDLKRAAGGDNG